MFRVDWPILVNAMEKIELKFYLLSILTLPILTFFSASKYYWLIKGTSVSQSIVSLMKINLISRFYGFFLPSSAGIGAVRWYKVTRNEKGRAFFLASTVFERSIFALILLFSGLIPLYLYPMHHEIVKMRAHMLPIILIFLVLAMAVIIYFIFPNLQRLLKSILMQILPSHGKWQKFFTLLDNFTLRKPPLTSFGYLLILSILWQLFNIVRVFLLSQALTLPLGFIDVLWIGSLVHLLQIIPVSFAGIGIREGAYAYLFAVFGLPCEQGIVLGILGFSHLLMNTIIGGLLVWSESGNKTYSRKFHKERVQ